MKRMGLILLTSTALVAGCVSHDRLSSEVWKTDGLKEETARLLFDSIPKGPLRIAEAELSIGEKLESPRGYWITFESAKVTTDGLHLATFRSPRWVTQTCPGSRVHVRPHEELSYTLVSNDTNRIQLRVRYPTKDGGLLDALFF